MTTLTDSPENARPYLCPRCGNPVPPKKLVCDCFARLAEVEEQRRIITNFLEGRSALWICDASLKVDKRHILLKQRKTLSLCGKFFRGAPQTFGVFRTPTIEDFLKSCGTRPPCTQCVYILDKLWREFTARSGRA